MQMQLQQPGSGEPGSNAANSPVRQSGAGMEWYERKILLDWLELECYERKILLDWLELEWYERPNAVNRIIRAHPPTAFSLSGFLSPT